jgi:hypothetical protein
MPECDNACAGERGKVDDGGGFEFFRVAERIGQDEPAFGVGIIDF